MSPLMVNAGIRSGGLHQGDFSANPHDYLEVCDGYCEATLLTIAAEYSQITCL